MSQKCDLFLTEEAESRELFSFFYLKSDKLLFNKTANYFSSEQFNEVSNPLLGNLKLKGINRNIDSIYALISLSAVFFCSAL